MSKYFTLLKEEEENYKPISEQKSRFSEWVKSSLLDWYNRIDTYSKETSWRTIEEAFSKDWFRDALSWLKDLSWMTDWPPIKREYKRWELPERFLNATSTFGATLWDIWWAPIVWAFNHFAWDPNSEWYEDWLIAKFWQKVEDTNKWIWDRVNYIFKNSYWRDLKEWVRENVWVSLTDASMGIWWYWIGKWLKYTWRWAKHVWWQAINSALDKIDLYKSWADDMEQLFYNTIEKHSNIKWTLFDEAEFKNNFQEFIDRSIREEYTVKDFEKWLLDLWVPRKEVKKVAKKVEEQKRVDYVESKTFTNLFWNFKSKVKKSQETKIKTELENRKFFNETDNVKKVKIIKEVKGEASKLWINPHNIDNVIENSNIDKVNWMSTDAIKMYELLLAQQNKSAVWKSSDVSELKANNLLYLKEKGILEEKKIKWKWYSYTVKNEKAFNKIIDEIPQDLLTQITDTHPSFRWNNIWYKDSLIKKWVSHHTEDFINNAKNKRNHNEIISVNDAIIAVNELLKKPEIKSIDEDIIKMEMWDLDEVWVDRLYNNIKTISDEYWLWIDVDKIRGSIKKTNNAVDKIDELMSDSFIKVEDIRHSWKKWSISFTWDHIWISNYTIKNLYKETYKISEKKFNKWVGVIRKKLSEATRRIKNSKNKTEAEKRALIKQKKIDFQRKKLILTSKYKSANDFKSQLIRTVKSLKDDPKYKGINIDRIVKRIVNKWFNEAVTEWQLIHQSKRLLREVDKEYVIKLKWEIEDLLKIDKNRSNTKYSSQKLLVKDLLKIKSFENFFIKNKKELNPQELENLRDSIKETKTNWYKEYKKNKFQKEAKYWEELEWIKSDILDKDWNKIKQVQWKKTIKDWESSVSAVGKSLKSFNNWTSFQFRNIEKIFKQSELWKKIFLINPKKVFDDYDFFENKVSKLLVRNLEILFPNKKARASFWKFLVARRRVFDDVTWEYNWIGLDRMLADKTSWLHKKSTKFENEPKPKFWDDMPDELWERARGTELWEILMEFDNPNFVKWMNMVDKYHKETWKIYQKTQMEVDNRLTPPEDFYIWFHYIKWWKSKQLRDMADWEFTPTWLDSTWTKLPKDTIVWDIELDYDPITIIMWVERKTRYYWYMAEQYKNIKKIYNWPSKTVLNMSVDELNKYASNPSTVFRVWWDIVDIIDTTPKDWKISVIRHEKSSLIHKEWELKWQPIIEKIPREVDVKDIEASVNKRWLDYFLNEEEQWIMEEYIKRIARWWNAYEWDSAHTLSRIAYHYNRLPLMWSVSVVAKQALSMIDWVWKIGTVYFREAMRDLRDSKLSRFIDTDVIEVSNRVNDPVQKELMSIKIDRNVLDKIMSGYDKYTSVLMSPIQYSDKIIYKRIWLSAFRKELIEKWIISHWDRITIDLIEKHKNIHTKAWMVADSVASTAHPLMMPLAYNSAWSKSLFGIFTTQLNRLQIMYNDVPQRWKSWDKSWAIFEASMLMTSNIWEVAITLAIWKFMYSIGATTWDWYEDDFVNLLLSMNTLERVTLWQTFMYSRYSWMWTGFSFSPLVWGLNKTYRGIESIKKAWMEKDFNLLVEEAFDFITENVWGKITEQLFNVYQNRGE